MAGVGVGLHQVMAGAIPIRGWQFVLHMVEQKKISHETYRQLRAALIFLYSVTPKRET